MILSNIELLCLAAYWILLYEYVVMRHMAVCAESDARIRYAYYRSVRYAPMFTAEWTIALRAQGLYFNRGTK